MGRFLDFMKNEFDAEYSYLGLLNESLNSPVAYSKVKKEETNERIVIVGLFNINNKTFEYLVEYLKEERAMNFIFHQLINNKAVYNIQNNLSKQEVLSVFSTVKVIISEYINFVDSIYFEAANEKLYNIYRKMFNTMINDFEFEFTSNGNEVQIIRTARKNFKNKNKIIFKNKNWKGEK